MLATVSPNTRSFSVSGQAPYRSQGSQAFQYPFGSVPASNGCIPAHLISMRFLTPDSEGNVKLCDFGLSTTDNHLLPLQDGINLSASFTDMTSGVGTHLYVSPDVIQNRTYGTKADLYSLGVCCPCPIKVAIAMIRRTNSMGYIGRSYSSRCVIR
jgi:serine/threonine protein kinase